MHGVLQGIKHKIGAYNPIQDRKTTVGGQWGTGKASKSSQDRSMIRLVHIDKGLSKSCVLWQDLKQKSNSA